KDRRSRRRRDEAAAIKNLQSFKHQLRHLRIPSLRGLSAGQSSACSYRSKSVEDGKLLLVPFALEFLRRRSRKRSLSLVDDGLLRFRIQCHRCLALPCGFHPGGKLPEEGHEASGAAAEME